MQEVEFLKFVVSNLVKNTEAINIDKTEDELWTLLTLSVDKEDMWVIIWKKWSTVNSLRVLLKLLWSKLDKRINLKVEG